MIWIAFTLILCAFAAVVTAAVVFNHSQRAQNRETAEVRKIAEASFTRVVALEGKMDSLHSILVTAEGIVCNVTDTQVSVMFANIHYPGLAQQKISYTVTVSRLPNEPCYVGQCRVFILHCYGNSRDKAVQTT